MKQTFSIGEKTKTISYSSPIRELDFEDIWPFWGVLIGIIVTIISFILFMYYKHTINTSGETANYVAASVGGSLFIGAIFGLTGGYLVSVVIVNITSFLKRRHERKVLAEMQTEIIYQLSHNYKGE